jgi:hypothetical protein
MQNLPPLPSPVEKLDLYERFTFLNCLMLIDRHGIDYLEGLSAQAGQEPPSADVKEWRAEVVKSIEWDRALRNGNRWYDRLAAAVQEKDGVSRKNKLHQIDTDLKALKKNFLDKGEFAGLLSGDDSTKGAVIGDLLVCLLVPALGKLASAADRCQQIEDNVILAFVLARYQREHGHYPKELAALVPKYLERIPQDLFSGQALIYRPKENGYLLYSVGVNGKDEDGRGYEDDPPGDDLSVRMPLPELKP